MRTTTYSVLPGVAALLAMLSIACSAGKPASGGVKAGARSSGRGEIACVAGDTALFPPHSVLTGRWYADQLHAAGERALCATGASEAYRFTWLRSFHHPIVVRAERLGDGYLLTAKQLDGAGGYKPGKLMVNRTSALSTDEWAHLTALVDSVGFWTAGPQPREQIGLDGAQWIVEGVAEHRYHTVDRWSPPEGDRGVRRLGLFMLQLARLTPAAPEPIY
jgi:hypothetical protein